MKPQTMAAAAGEDPRRRASTGPPPRVLLRRQRKPGVFPRQALHSTPASHSGGRRFSRDTRPWSPRSSGAAGRSEEASATRSGAGMMDCKSGLEEANGNFAEEANTFSGRRPRERHESRLATSDGLIGFAVSDDHAAGTLVEGELRDRLVANTDDFKTLIKNVLAEIDKAGDVQRRVAEGSEWSDSADGGSARRQAWREHGRAALRALRRSGAGRPTASTSVASSGDGRVLRRDAGGCREGRIPEPCEGNHADCSGSVRCMPCGEVPADAPREGKKAIYRGQMENSRRPT